MTVSVAEGAILMFLLCSEIMLLCEVLALLLS